MNLIDIFERLHYNVLLKKIESYVSERQIYDLICEIIKVSYVNSFNLMNSKFRKKDIPFQGSILRPFLINVFFDRLDKWVKNNLFFKYNLEKKDHLNLKYLKIVDKSISAESNEVFTFIKERVSLIKIKKICKAFSDVKKNQIANTIFKYYATDLKYKKLWYVRYYTHMLFGLIGPKQDAVAVFKEIKIDLEENLNLKIQLKKAGINHYSDGILFLGYWIFGNYDFKLNLAVQDRHSKRLKFSIPIKILIKSYANKGFFQIAKKGKNMKYVGRRVNK